MRRRLDDAVTVMMLTGIAETAAMLDRLVRVSIGHALDRQKWRAFGDTEVPRSRAFGSDCLDLFVDMQLAPADEQVAP